VIYDDPQPEEERQATGLRPVPIDWGALADAFENNAPEVHSYLHLETGDVLRATAGVTDPAVHARIAGDRSYLKVDPASSREQYRWMEQFTFTLEDGRLRSELEQAIDGKGAFRRFKDVLANFPFDRERWLAHRADRLRACMETWLDAQGIEAVPRPAWEATVLEEPRSVVVAVEAGSRRAALRGGSDGRRRRLRELADLLPSSELHAGLAFLEFLRERSAEPSSEARNTLMVVDERDSRAS